MADGFANTKYVRISPRKARIIAGLIQGKPVVEAVVQLSQSGTKSARLLLRSLKSAVANAENEHGLKAEEMKVKEARVDDGPTMKRSNPKSKGGSHPILKRSSNFMIRVGV